LRAGLIVSIIPELDHSKQEIVTMSQDTPDRIIRIRTVLARTGLSRSTVYRKIQSGSFPRQIKISDRCAGWRESAVEDWLNDPRSYSVGD
jgi:prophage regulatory protein